MDVVRPDGILDPHGLPRPLGSLAAVGARGGGRAAAPVRVVPGGGGCHGGAGSRVGAERGGVRQPGRGAAASLPSLAAAAEAGAAVRALVELSEGLVVHGPLHLLQLHRVLLGNLAEHRGLLLAGVPDDEEGLGLQGGLELERRVLGLVVVVVVVLRRFIFLFLIVGRWAWRYSRPLRTFGQIVSIIRGVKFGEPAFLGQSLPGRSACAGCRSRRRRGSRRARLPRLLPPHLVSQKNIP